MTHPPTTLLEVSGVRKEFNNGDSGLSTIAVEDVSFNLGAKEFLSIVGPSGCGKTTLVKIIAGLTRPTNGSVRIRGQAVTDPPHALTMVFQDYGRSLLPWKKVSENVIFGMHNLTLDAPAKRERASLYLEMVGLGVFADFYPWMLSGGMQQRVAIARALAKQPEILIMDEPFGSLDAQTRLELEDELLRLWAEFGLTIILVTHDIDEAIYLSDRVLVMGRHGHTTIADIRTDLPRPREQLLTRAAPCFSQLRNRIYGSLREADASSVAA